MVSSDFHVSASKDSRASRSRALSALVAALTTIVLALTAHTQIFDTNFQTLWQSTAVLNGDHPYRDFFEWGLPLQTAFSMAAQVLSGHRLIGEFVVQWLFIVMGMVISFDLALRASGSKAASLVAMLLAVVILAATPTYHYPKLFFYPLALWLLWRYMDAPSARRSAALGAITSIAFLFRHDHGLYIGTAWAMAFVLTQLARRSSRSVYSFATDAAAYAVTAAAVLTPWAIVVHLNEGLVEYVRARAYLYADWSAKDVVYRSILKVGPVQALAPVRENAVEWLHQVVLLIPLLLLVVATLNLLRSWRRAEPVAAETYPLIVAATLLIVIESQTFRESSYFIVVVPVAAAMGARLLVSERRGGLWSFARRALVLGMLLVTTVATVTFVRISGIFTLDELPLALRPAYRQLLASPPIDAYQPLDAALRYERHTWREAGDDRIYVTLRYVRDCTRADDRLLVTGSTPYQVGYYTGRSVAGGHLFWHHGWRSDPAHEAESLALLRRQSVPFVVSTTDPILEDFKRYPGIREHLANNYVELDGAEGQVLVDKRRKPTGSFGVLGFPCFR